MAGDGYLNAHRYNADAKLHFAMPGGRVILSMSFLSIFVTKAWPKPKQSGFGIFLSTKQITDHVIYSVLALLAN